MWEAPDTPEQATISEKTGNIGDQVTGVREQELPAFRAAKNPESCHLLPVF
jgi:hypothetical protein